MSPYLKRPIRTMEQAFQDVVVKYDSMKEHSEAYTLKQLMDQADLVVRMYLLLRARNTNAKA